MLRTDTKMTFKVWDMDPTFICRPLADFSQNETTAWLQQNFAGSLKKTYDGTMDGTALLAFAESKDALSRNSALLDLVPLSQLPRLVSAIHSPGDYQTPITACLLACMHACAGERMICIGLGHSTGQDPPLPVAAARHGPLQVGFRV